jgi:hypothetical protein
MAWQIVVLNLSGESPHIAEPTDDQAIPLGSADAVRRQISECFPSVNWDDPTQGRLVADDDAFTLTFGVVEREVVSGFVIDVRGGREAMSALVKLARATGWRLYDCSASWIDVDNPSYAGWEGYDRVRRNHTD